MQPAEEGDNAIFYLHAYKNLILTANVNMSIHHL